MERKGYKFYYTDLPGHVLNFNQVNELKRLGNGLKEHKVEFPLRSPLLDRKVPIIPLYRRMNNTTWKYFLGGCYNTVNSDWTM